MEIIDQAIYKDGQKIADKAEIIALNKFFYDEKKTTEI